jgi:hypothetical protein
MSRASIVNWERRRTALSHDTLKNQVKPAVFKLCNVLAGKVSDPDFGAGFGTGACSRIDTMCSDIVTLARDAGDALSPRHYLDETPLQAVPGKTMQWLGCVAHCSWLERVRLNDRVAAAVHAAAMVRERTARLNATLAVPTSEPLDVARDLLASLDILAGELASMATLAPYKD